MSSLLVALVISVVLFTSGHADDESESDEAIPLAVTGVASETAPPPTPLGDASLRPLVDLGRMQIAGGRYQVGLEDGRTAVLTLEPAIQARAEAILREADAPYGAVVVMAPDGRILAMAARSTAEPDKQPEDLLLAPWAPAASVFKIVTSAALVDKGVGSDTEVCYHGGLRSVEASNLVDDPKADGTCNDLRFGLAKSQNAILAKLAAKHLDAAALRRMAQAFGFGRAPDFALRAAPCKAEIPETPLEFARVAAGFWQTELSPLGGALLTNVIASGGMEVTPRLVGSVIGQDGVERPTLPRPARRVLAVETAGAVAQMMADTVRMGTGYAAFHDKKGTPYLGDVSVAGKTGSLSKNEPSYVNYSWFVGFAPVEAPRYVIAVALGNSATWRVKAHTAARIVLEAALGE